MSPIRGNIASGPSVLTVDFGESPLKLRLFRRVHRQRPRAGIACDLRLGLGEARGDEMRFIGRRRRGGHRSSSPAGRRAVRVLPMMQYRYAIRRRSVESTGSCVAARLDCSSCRIGRLWYLFVLVLDGIYGRSGVN
jgi:hypothetical protein